jgi:hypothetical protein
MGYTQAMRGANIFLWAQRAPHLAKRSGVLPTLQSNGTNITAATSGWNLTAAAALGLVRR